MDTKSFFSFCLDRHPKSAGSPGNTPTTSSSTATKTGDVLALPALSSTGTAFTEILNDENAHVTFLHDALMKAGATPRPKPTFKGLQQSNINSFASLSQTFENVGIGAYLMAAPAIKTSAYLAAAG